MECKIGTHTAKNQTYLYGGGWAQSPSNNRTVIQNNFFQFMKLGNWISGDVYTGSPKERFKVQGSTIMRMLADDVGLSEYELKFKAGDLASTGNLVLQSKHLVIIFMPVHGLLYFDPDLSDDYKCWLTWDEMITSYQRSCFRIRRYISEMEWNKRVKQAKMELHAQSGKPG